MADLTVRFGGLLALDGAFLEVPVGSFVGLIGPNGAGKTTLFNVVSGFVSAETGRLRYMGRRIDDWPAHRRAAAGIARTFQTVGLDRRATLLENMERAREMGGLGDDLLGLIFGAASRPRESMEPEVADGIIRRLGLANLLDERVGDLPAGTARLAEIACALLRRPALLLLDEPAAGLERAETDRLREVLLELHETSGLSILLIEHDMRLVMRTVDHLYVLNFGRVIAQGVPEEVRNDPRVVEAYLGHDRVGRG